MLKIGYLWNVVHMRDKAWFLRLYGEIIPTFSKGIIDRTGAQPMLYLTCITITSVDLADYGVSRAKDWVPVKLWYKCVFTAPFANYLAVKTSFRLTTFAGGLLLGIGYVTSCFVSRLEYLFLTLGLVTGTFYTHFPNLSTGSLH